MVVVAISGKPGAGSSTSAKLLAERLGLKFFSSGNYMKSFSSKEDETEKALDVMATKEGTSEDFHNNLDDLQKAEARDGNIVVEGKMTIIMLKDIADYSVWFTASPDVRARRYAQRGVVDEKTGREQLEEKERKERDLFKKIYKTDFFIQERQADLIVDTGDKTPQQIVDLIIKHLKEKELIM